MVDLQNLPVRSSWYAGNGNVQEIKRKRNGQPKPPKPGKKRGKPTTETQRLLMRQKIEAARERRRSGYDTTTRG